MAEAKFFVGVHAVIANRGRLLTLRRAPAMTYAPDTWDLPGGHLAIGESIEQCLAREVAEETALDVAIERAIGAHNTLDESYVQVIYACRLRIYQSVRLRPEEHVESRWVTVQELAELNLIPYLAGILRRGMLTYVK